MAVRPLKRKPASKRKPMRKLAIRRPIRSRGTGVREFASSKEIYTISGMTSNNMFSDIEQNIGDYPRAKALAAYYQFYRIKYIKYKFLNRYNQFLATTNETVATPIPYLHFMIDKSGSLPTNTTIGMMKAEGAVPKKFTQPITVAWKPGVTLGVSNADNTAILGNRAAISPWLMTNKTAGSAGFTINDADHKGLYWYLETLGGLPGDGTYEFDAEVEVFFEFKKPNYPIGASVGTPAIKVSTLRQTVVNANGVLEEVVKV